MQANKSGLRACFQSLGDIPEEERVMFERAFSLAVYPPKHFLLFSGDVFQEVFFITVGLV